MQIRQPSYSMHSALLTMTLEDDRCWRGNNKSPVTCRWHNITNQTLRCLELSEIKKTCMASVLRLTSFLMQVTWVNGMYCVVCPCSAGMLHLMAYDEWTVLCSSAYSGCVNFTATNKSTSKKQNTVIANVLCWMLRYWSWNKINSTRPFDFWYVIFNWWLMINTLRFMLLLEASCVPYRLSAKTTNRNSFYTWTLTSFNSYCLNQGHNGTFMSILLTISQGENNDLCGN